MVSKGTELLELSERTFCLEFCLFCLPSLVLINFAIIYRTSLGSLTSS